jgi:hypothetical protein
MSVYLIHLSTKFIKVLFKIQFLLHMEQLDLEATLVFTRYVVRTAGILVMFFVI